MQLKQTWNRINQNVEHVYTWLGVFSSLHHHHHRRQLKHENIYKKGNFYSSAPKELNLFSIAIKVALEKGTKKKEVKVKREFNKHTRLNLDSSITFALGLKWEKERNVYKIKLNEHGVEGKEKEWGRGSHIEKCFSCSFIVATKCDGVWRMNKELSGWEC